jgi:chaperonin cofactor prefoldin
MSSRIKILTAAVATTALLAFIGAACGGDNTDYEPQISELQSQLSQSQGRQDQLQTQLEGVQTSLDEILQSIAATQLVAALDALDGTGIHDFDEQSIQATSLDDIPSGYLADVRKIARIVGSLSWPEDLHDDVDEILEQADTLEAALASDDLAGIKAASPQFHIAWHTLREVGYDALSGEGPSSEEQHGEHDDMEMGS